MLHAFCSQVGLCGNHAYSVLDVREIFDPRFMGRELGYGGAQQARSFAAVQKKRLAVSPKIADMKEAPELQARLS